MGRCGKSKLQFVIRPEGIACRSFIFSLFIASKPFPFVTSVHKDLSERLPAFNRPLFLQVKEILDLNKAERHIRGGIATRRKYKGD